MARIRSVKPEFWEDEEIGLLSRDARLLYIATWNMADDEGLLRWSPSYIKANAFMYDDDLSVADVERLMGEITDVGLILPYVAGKSRQSLGWVIQFSRHQKPNRPQPSKLPPPSIQNGAVLLAYVRRDSNLCHLCGHECSTEHDKQRLWPSLDHLTPRSQGGSDYPSNIKLSHVSCNKSRRDRPVESCNGSAPVRSLNDSLNNSVNTAEDDSLLEGRGGEKEQEGSRRGEVALRADQTTPDDPTSALLIEHVNAYAQPPPPSAVTPIRREIMKLVAEHVEPDRIRAGLARLRDKQLSASLLPQLVTESTPSRRPSTTDQRVADALALRARYEAEESA